MMNFIVNRRQSVSIFFLLLVLNRWLRSHTKEADWIARSQFFDLFYFVFLKFSDGSFRADFSGEQGIKGWMQRLRYVRCPWKIDSIFGDTLNINLVMKNRKIKKWKYEKKLTAENVRILAPSFKWVSCVVIEVCPFYVLDVLSKFLFVIVIFEGQCLNIGLEYRLNFISNFKTLEISWKDAGNKIKKFSWKVAKIRMIVIQSIFESNLA